MVFGETIGEKCYLRSHGSTVLADYRKGHSQR